MKNNKYYITTPIYYVNAKPHLGHTYTTLAADILARYNRLKGKDVFFLTGTDEHGAKIAQAAEEANLEPKKFCDKISAEYQSAWDSLNISNDKFVRTTDEEHKKSVENFFNVLKEKGAIYEGKYEGLYCTGCEKFITEKELVGGKCPDHQVEPEKISEKNYFFKLKDYLKEVRELIETNKIKVEPENIKKEILGLFKQDLQDFSVSRESVKWGIKLPFDKSQVAYVWVEALQNYISAIGFESDRDMFLKYWPADLHLMGKEIIKFHVIYWPAMLLATGLETPKEIFAHGFFTIDGQKMSKTLGNVIDPNELVKEYGSDAARYLILSQFPFSQDGDIKADKFKEQYNDQLANNLGNMFSRIMKLAQDARGKEIDTDNSIKNKIIEVWSEYEKAMGRNQIVKALDQTRLLIDFGNKYIDDNKPWELKKTDLDQFTSVMRGLVELLRHIAWMIRPYIPETSNKILVQLGVFEKEKELSLEDNKKWQEFDLRQIKEGVILFPRI